MKTYLKHGIISLQAYLLPVIAFAQINNPIKAGSIPVIISQAMTLVVRVGSVIAVLAFIWAGYKFVVAQGKPEELKTAKDIFFYTVVGVAILLGAQLIASIVVGTVRTLGN